MSQPDAAEQNIQMWKVKKLIKSLDSARGCVDLEPFAVVANCRNRAGTSMISLIIPPKVRGGSAWMLPRGNLIDVFRRIKFLERQLC